jgi:myo-inositol-1(or 4)-monophosphatase
MEIDFDSALELVYTAGLTLLSTYRQNIAIHAKDGQELPNNLVTSADLASEKVILDYIRSRYPEDTIISEEATGEEVIIPALPGNVWYVDPLDGTSNYAHGLDAWAISIAAIDRLSGETKLAIVHAPALERTWYACDQQAFRKVATRPVESFTARHHKLGKILNLGLAYERFERTLLAGIIPSLILEYADIRYFGCCSVNLCLLAEGAVDAYLELSVKNWDWRAAAHIAKTAGSHVATPDNPRTQGYAIAGASTLEDQQKLEATLTKLLAVTI